MPLVFDVRRVAHRTERGVAADMRELEDYAMTSERQHHDQEPISTAPGEDSSGSAAMIRRKQLAGQNVPCPPRSSSGKHGWRRICRSTIMKSRMMK